MPLSELLTCLAVNGHLRELRERRGWSVRELGERAGVSYVTVSRVENGRMSPTVALLGELARALGVPARDLDCSRLS